ncbi:MAG: PQQ-binding-like beta-propeller repeat protein [Thermotogae bacterium]|nr:PQQ-binding-like beta-propeller repeat protein [Thermotogota bacterium]
MIKRLVAVIVLLFVIFIGGCVLVNKPPQLQLQQQYELDEGTRLELDLVSTVKDETPAMCVFEKIYGVGEILSFCYFYSPDYDASGIHEVCIGVTDPRGASSTSTFHILVRNVNRPPSLAISDLEILEGKSLELDLLEFTSDPDASESFTFKLLEGVGSVNKNTYAYTASYEASGIHHVIIEVEDAFKEVASDTFNIVVHNVNRPPSLTIPDQQIKEGEALLLELMDYASDPDPEDSLTFRLVEGMGDVLKSLYTYHADFEASGVYQIRIETTDSLGSSDLADFTVTVFNVNRSPSLEIPDQEVTEGKTLTLLLPNFTRDEDASETFTYELLKGPGDISENLYSFTPDYDASGIHDITIAVEDSHGSTSVDSFQITVLNKNRPPSMNLPDVLMSEGLSISFDLSDYATDPDGDELSFQKLGGPGKIEGSIFTYSAGYEDSGTHKVTVEAHDGLGGKNRDSFNIWVTERNRKPWVDLDSPAANHITTSGDVQLTWHGEDPDGDALVYDVYLGRSFPLTPLVTNLTTPRYAAKTLEAGTYYWQIGVRDDRGAESRSEARSFTIHRPPTTPTLLSPSPGATDQHLLLTFDWAPSTDPDGDAVSYTVYLDTDEVVDFAVAENIKDTSIQLNDLQPETLYYWKVVAKDARGATVSSAVSTFTTGRVFWTFTTGNSIMTCPAVDSEGVLYLGSDDGKVYALDATGNLKWSYDTGGAVRSSPSILGIGIVFGTSSGSWIYLDSSGQEVWGVNHGVSDLNTTAALGDRVYVVEPGIALKALDPLTGDQIWSVEKDFRTSPVRDKSGTLYVGINEGLVACDKNGSILWELEINGVPSVEPAIAESGRVYLCVSSGSLYALNTDGSTATVAWTLKLGDSIKSNPIISPDGTVYVGTVGVLTPSALYAVEPWGEIRWKLEMPDWVRSTAVIGSSGNVYVGCDDDRVYAVSPGGTILWSVATDGNVMAPLTLSDDGLLYLGTYSGTFYTIKTDDSLAEGIWPKFRRTHGNTGTVP